MTCFYMYIFFFKKRNYIVKSTDVTCKTFRLTDRAIIMTS